MGDWGGDWGWGCFVVRGVRWDGEWEGLIPGRYWVDVMMNILYRCLWIALELHILNLSTSHDFVSSLGTFHLLCLSMSRPLIERPIYHPPYPISPNPLNLR